MNEQQLALIPDKLLKPNRFGSVTPLLDWLAQRGWAMSLLELEQERARRGLKLGNYSPARKTTTTRKDKIR